MFWPSRTMRCRRSSTTLANGRQWAGWRGSVSCILIPRKKVFCKRCTLSVKKHKSKLGYFRGLNNKKDELSILP